MARHTTASSSPMGPHSKTLQAYATVKMQVSSPVRRTTTGSSHPLLGQPGAGALWETEIAAGPADIAPGVEGLQQLALQACESQTAWPP